MISDYLQWLILSIIQGLTEFLPISSSAHLILTSQILGWKDQGLIFDIAAHFGSLLAVIWYFRLDILRILSGKNNTLFIQITLASIPIALTGFLSANLIENHLRSPVIIAYTSIIFGVALWWSQRFQTRSNKVNTFTAIAIGCAQVLALIPGVSRSGICLTAAMILGVNKTQAARFSFLLAIPTILMTSSYGAYKLTQQPMEIIKISNLALVIFASFLSALLTIKVFLKLIDRLNFTIFMYYRVLLGLIILWLI